jgi:hypothetical protein
MAKRKRRNPRLGVIAVNHLQSPGSVLRKLILFAGLGAATVALFGPLVALLSVVLSFAMVLFSFALVGFLVWSLFQVIFHGRQDAAARVHAFWQGLRQTVPAVGERVARVIRFPFRVLGRLLGGLRDAAGFVLRRTWLATRFVGAVAPAAVTGVLVGALAGVAVGAPNLDFAMTVPANALFGGLIGVGAGVAMTVLERRTPVRASSPGVG